MRPLGNVGPALALALASGTAQGEQNSPDLFQLSLAELLEVQVEVATRSQGSLRSSPASVSVYTRQDIAQLGLKTLNELLVLVPGVQVTRTDQGSVRRAVSFRGRRPNSSARDVLVLLNGMRLNEVVNGSALARLGELPLHGIKQVEVIRGTGSALYGANAFSGVINLVTATGLDALTLGAGSWGAREAALSKSLRWGEFSADLSVYHYRDEGDNYPGFYNFWGYRDDTQDPMRLRDVSLDLRYRGWQLSVLHNEHRFGDFIDSGAQLDGLQRSLLSNRLVQLRYQHALGPLQLNWFVRRDRGESDYLIGLFPANPMPLPQPAFLYWAGSERRAMVGGNVRETYADETGVDLRWAPSAAHSISFGFSRLDEGNGDNPYQGNWNAEHQRLTGDLIPTPESDPIQQGFYLGGVRFDLLTPQDRRVLGAYVQDEWTLAEGRTLTLGVRHDDYDDVGSNTSLRGGYVHQIGPRHVFKLLYGEAFRAPSFAETRAGIGSIGRANPALKPETVQTSELSWTYEADRWQSNLTLFHNRYQDIVRFVVIDDVVTGLTATQPQNTGNGKVRGVEWELRAQPSASLLVRAGFAHAFDRLAGEAVASTSAFAVAQYHLGQVDLGLTANYLGSVPSRAVGEVGNSAPIRLEDYWLLNASLRWHPSSTHFWQLKIDNLFDRQHVGWSPQRGLDHGVPERGRSLHLSFNRYW